MDNPNLVIILQASLTPVILISGVGLLLLSMTNRMARPVDRIRHIAHEIKTATQQDKKLYYQQIEILYRRCFMLKKAILLAATSISCVSVMILLLFCLTSFNMNISFLVEAVFLVSLVSLMLSLFYFTLDVRTSLQSVQIEMERLNFYKDT